jgi:tRNA nucleotidyltransferase/poly(A) polymerase
MTEYMMPVITNNRSSFKEYIFFREGKENFDQPHIIKADPPMKIPDGIKRLADAFKKSKEVAIGKEIDSKAGGEKDVTLKSKKIFIVGGAVRDYLLGHTPRNYDLATDAHPEEVLKILHQARPPIHIHKQDSKEGITHISVDGEAYEIKTLKKKPNPDADEEGSVFTVNPAEDCENRDVTINALYYDVAANQIIDHCGGIRHLQDGVVRPIGNADEKLKKDGMTKYRMIRMMNILPNGRMDDDTKNSIAKYAGEDDDLPPEKIREEFLRGLEHAHTNVKKYIKSYHDNGLLEKVFPHLQLSYEFPDCGTCKNRAIVLAYLLKDNKPAKLVKQLRELKYTDREIKDAVYLINLLWFGPDHIYDFKRELLNTSLTKRQLIDWAKLNKLDKEMIQKLIDYNFKVSDNAVMEKEGLQGDMLRDRVKRLEADEFKKTLSKD